MYTAFTETGSPARRTASDRGGDVRADLSYIRRQDTKPVLLSAAYTGGAPEERFSIEPHTVAIRDLRPQAASFTLDRHGFAFRKTGSGVRDFYDDGEVRTAYFDEVGDLLVRETGAARVAIFDATRRSDGAAGAANRDGSRGPASRIHVDYTAHSGPQRARDVLGSAEVDRLLTQGRRILQVNVWRPIAGPVRRSPLAVADASSVAPEDLIATDQIFPDRIGEIYHLAYNPVHRWFHAPAMTPDEVLLIKGWDSLDDGRARFTPHAAFRLPDQDDGAPPRESIEVRSFIVI